MRWKGAEDEGTHSQHSPGILIPGTSAEQAKNGTKPQSNQIHSRELKARPAVLLSDTHPASRLWTDLLCWLLLVGGDFLLLAEGPGTSCWQSRAGPPSRNRGDKRGNEWRGRESKERDLSMCAERLGPSLDSLSPVGLLTCRGALEFPPKL